MDGASVRVRGGCAESASISVCHSSSSVLCVCASCVPRITGDTGAVLEGGERGRAVCAGGEFGGVGAEPKRVCGRGTCAMTLPSTAQRVASSSKRLT